MNLHKMMGRVLCGMLPLLLLAIGGVPQNTLAAGGTWSILNPMPTPRYGAASGVINGKLYVASGVSSWVSRTQALEVYDPATDAWTTKAPIPQSLYAAATGVIDGKLYVAGGQGPPVGNLATLQVYDSASDTWTFKAPMPFASAHPAGGVIDGKLYVAGGMDPSNNYMVNTLRVYDPANDTWTTKAPMPTARAWAGGAVMNGILYVVGGFYNSPQTCIATVEAYDPATNTWTTKAPMPTARMGMAIGVINGILYAVGGATANSLGAITATVEAYNPATDNWTAQAPMLTPTFASAAGIIGGKLYTAGGIGLKEVILNVLEAFTPGPPLVANAGPNQTVSSGAQVQLDGSNSTPASDIVSYQWLQTSGPTVTLSDPTLPRPTFSAPQVGVSGASLVFQLTVTNQSGQSSQAACTITVTLLNQPPVANAGPVQTVKGGDSVTLDGSKSTDPDDGIASYAWTQTGGPAVQLSDPAAAKPSFTAPTVGMAGAALTFQLTVTDNHGLTATSSCIVNVTWGNQPPVANAGADQTKNDGDTVTLNGSGSTDPDDGIASYLWAQLSGTPITLSDAKAVQPTFTAPHVKYGGDVLTFQLTVTDRGGLQSSARCAVNVQWVNTPPVAKVAGNLTILSKDQGLTTLQGTARDADGDPLTYRWLKGTNELFPSQAVGADGTTPLNLGAITAPLAVGQHTLTLEVSDGYAISTDTMLLTVDNSAPTVAPTGEGAFQVNTPVSLGGQVSDYDGDLLSYQWLEGNAVLNSDYVQAAAGGAPVNLPQFTISSLKVGTHTLTLQVSDKVNSPVAKTISVNIIDNTAPTLAPMADKTILWPPNKQMVPVTIKANAIDNSGMPVTLKVAVACNESQDGAVYWTQPVIDQNAGTISLQLQANRLGKGDGRQYTVTITATDQSGNFSTANVKILVPHDQGKN